MPSKSLRRRPALEALEGRLALSSGLPADTLDVVQGVVPPAGAVANISTTVAPKNLTPGKSSTVIGFQVTPNTGSGAVPKILEVLGPSGTPLRLLHGSQYFPGIRPATQAYAEVSTPGKLTVVLSGTHGTSGAVTVREFLPGDSTGDGQVTLEDTKIYSVAFLSSFGQGFYNPSADFNSNGFVGQDDGRLLERNLPPLSPQVPLTVAIHLPFDEVARGTQAKTSGAVTRLSTVTIIGKTIPGSLVYTDNGLGNYAFNNKVLPTDSRGFFSYKLHLKDKLTNTEYLVISPFGQQTIRAFPILRIS